MKGCLKLTSRSPSPVSEGQQPTLCSHRKCVAFGPQISEEVHIADEWDRTPTEPARKLTYQDLLELKEIQRSLPRANQPKDMITGRPGRHYLSAVPIGLLPLLPESDDSAQSSQNSSSLPSPVTSPRSSSPTFPCTQHHTGPLTSSSEPSTVVSPWAINFHRQKPPPPRVPPTSGYRGPPAHLAHLLPSRAPSDRQQRPRFNFLPLLDTPPSSGNNSPYTSNSPSRTPSPPASEHDQDLASDTDLSLDPPTPSLTNASLDSSPHSRASSCSPEPPFLRLGLPRDAATALAAERVSLIGAHDSYFPPQDEHAPLSHLPLKAPSAPIRLHAMHGPNLLPPSPLSLEVPIVAPRPKPAKKRNFILVNDIEIELDDDDDDEDDEEVLETAVEAKEDPQDVQANELTLAISSLSIDDTALSETNAQSPIPSSNPTTKLESSWSDPRPTVVFEPLMTPTPTPVPSPPRTPKSARTSSMSPPPSPTRSTQKSSCSRHWSRPLSPPPTAATPNLHMPIMFKRAQPRDAAGGGSH